MTFRSIALALALAVSAAGLSQPAMADLVTSDGCAPGERDFSVTANSVVGCLLVGSGNINGSNQGDQGFIESGWIFIDSSNGAGGAHDGWLSGPLTSGLSGTFSINPLASAEYDRIAVGFKSGNGRPDPDWAIFELGDGTLSGSWAISGNQQLGHAILYGFGERG